MTLYAVSNDNAYKKELDYDKAVLHRGYESWMGFVGNCNGRVKLTAGKWSFRAPSDWTPETPPDAPELVFKALVSQGVPPWAYQIKACSRCFKDLFVEHQCSCGNKHKIDKRSLTAQVELASIKQMISA